MPRQMCPERQRLENDLSSAHSHKTAFDRLVTGRTDLDPPEEAERRKVYSEYNSVVAAVNQHKDEAPSRKCGCE